MNVTLSADQPAGEAGLTQTGKPPWGGKGGPGAENGIAFVTTDSICADAQSVLPRLIFLLVTGPGPP